MALRSVVLSLTILFFAGTGEAQSLLNFPRIVQGDGRTSGIAVTNPSSYFADVQFSFYGEDGLPIVDGLVNPVTYRIPPRGQLALPTAVLFGEGKAEGWVQASSPTAGLVGTYSNGDFTENFSVFESAVSLVNQVIPYLPEGDGVGAEIVLTNAGAKMASPSIVFYDSQGHEVNGPYRPMLGAREQWRVKAPVGAAWARIASNAAVVAGALVLGGGALVYMPAQAAEDVVRVAPLFIRDATFRSTLILTNPNPASATASVTLFNPGRNAAPVRQTVEVPANGTRLLRAGDFPGYTFRFVSNGWLSVEPDGVSLAAMTLVESDRGFTSYPLDAASDWVLFSGAVDLAAVTTSLSLINPAARAVSVEVSLVRADGATLAVGRLALGSNEKVTKLLGDLVVLPENESPAFGAAFLTLHANAPVYALDVLSTRSGDRIFAAESPGVLPPGFVVDAPATLPLILRVEPDGELRPGARLEIFGENLTSDSTVTIGGHAVAAKPGNEGSIVVDLPANTEPGFVNLKVRAAGRNSKPWPLRVGSPDGLQLTSAVDGRAFYEKPEVGDNGLDLSRTAYVPCRGCRVEIFDPVLGVVVAVSETDDLGRFSVPAPPKANLVVRVVSRRRDSALEVADNTNGNALYAISRDGLNAAGGPASVLLVDTGRGSGAFNILEVIQRANEFVTLADSRIDPPGVTVFWSVRNTNRSGNPHDGLIGTTYFDAATGTAYVLGDRTTDSDEFDDAVILHEYAHLLLAHYSRDDSPGGPHGVGDVEDPRLAWSEGLANFFSGAVRNDPGYRDSRGMNGATVLRYDLEENVPAGDVPGYWSEASVGSLLWDLFDDRSETGDPVQFSMRSIWAALTDLRAARYVYLPYFLDDLIVRNPGASAAIRSMAALRRIDYRPNDDPTVANPFPRPIEFGETVSGEVDSLTPERTNLMQSSHFFWFTTEGGPVSIRLEISGLGNPGDPKANDLDLFLFDASGKNVAKSIGGSNGQPENIRNMPLPAGNYVVEVRSFYTKASTGALVFNSGRYRLTLN